MGKGPIVFRFAALLFAVSSLPLLAQTQPDVLDRFSLGLGSYIASSATVVTLNGNLPGTEVDFEEDLGVDDGGNLFKAEFDWRFADRHQIGLGYYSLDRSQTRQITGEIIFDDVVFPVDTVVETSLGLDFIDLSYTYWAYRTEDKAFGIKGGLVAMSISAGLKNIPQSGESPLELEGRGSTDLPVPGIGAAYKQLFGTSWLLDTRILFLPTVEIDAYEGDTLNATAAMEYRFLDHYAIGAAYSYLGFRVAVDKPSFDGELNYRIHGGNIYAKFYW